MRHSAETQYLVMSADALPKLRPQKCRASFLENARYGRLGRSKYFSFETFHLRWDTPITGRDWALAVGRHPYRPLNSSFLGLPYRILNRDHKKELLRGLRVGRSCGLGGLSICKQPTQCSAHSFVAHSELYVPLWESLQGLCLQLFYPSNLRCVS